MQTYIKIHKHTHKQTFTHTHWQTNKHTDKHANTQNTRKYKQIYIQRNKHTYI